MSVSILPSLSGENDKNGMLLRESACQNMYHGNIVHDPILSIGKKKLDKATSRYGYFALISNEVKDSIEALELYRTRDVVEKAFGNIKDRLNGRRTIVSSEQSLNGKLFVQFVALIFLSYVKKQMQDNCIFLGGGAACPTWREPLVRKRSITWCL